MVLPIIRNRPAVRLGDSAWWQHFHPRAGCPRFFTGKVYMAYWPSSSLTPTSPFF